MAWFLASTNSAVKLAILVKEFFTFSVRTIS